MKKLMKLMMGIAVAAISFTGCENNFEGANVENKGFELTVVADNLSRTEYDATIDDIKWSAGDVAQVLVKGVYNDVTASVDADDARIASFTWAPAAQYASAVTEGVHTVQAYFPKSAYVSCQYNNTGDTSVEKTHATRYGLELPKAQTATTATFDKSADILVADDMDVEITADDLAAGKKTVGNFHFRRMVAISEFTYKVTNTELLASEEKVASVSFEVVSTGKKLAGRMYIQPNADGAKYVTNDLEEITDNKDYFYDSDASKVTVTLSDTPALKSGFKAWFVTSPVTLDADDKLIFTVVTDKGTTITKTVETVGKEVSFLTTQKNTLTVNLNNAVEIEKAEEPEVGGVLADGNYVMIVKNGTKYLAVSSADATSNKRRVAVEATNYTDGAATYPTNDDAIVWNFTATTGGYYIQQGGKYLYGTDNQNYLQLGTTEDVIKVVDQENGTYQLLSSNNTTDERSLALNGSLGTNGEFSFYKLATASGNGYTDDIILVPAVADTTPRLSVVAQPAVVAAEGATVAVELNASNLTDAITVSENADWITDAAVADDKLTFTVTENTFEEERDTTITLTSGDLTAEVTVKQAAKAAAGAAQWVKVTSLADVTPGTYVITAGDYYLPNATASSKPAGKTLASANVAVSGNVLSGDVADGMKWELSGTTSAMKVTQFGGTNVLYNSSSTTVAVGSSTNTWAISAVTGGFYFTSSNNSRVLALYSSQDWRAYTTSNPTNNGAAVATLVLYKLSGGDAGEGGGDVVEPATPTLSIDKSSLKFEAAGGSQTVTATTTNYDGAITATSNDNHFTASVSGNVVTVTAAKNEDTTKKTATITIKAGDLSESVSVEQAAGEVSGGESSSVKWVKVTSASDITAGGEYVLAAKHTSGTYAYIPNAAVTSSGVTLKSSSVLSGTEIDDSNVSADMKWTLVASGSGFKIQSSASSSNILYTNNNTGNNVRISNGSARNEWTFTVDNSYGWKISNGTHRLAVYSATSLRNYGATTTTNQNGTFIIFKKSN